MPVDLISTAMTWAYKAIATWYVAAIVGGVLILIAEPAREAGVVRPAALRLR